MFEQTVYPVLARIINSVIRSEELASIALVLAWYYWKQDGGKQEPRCYAHYAIKHSLSGRDLPGVKEYTDIMDRGFNSDGMRLHTMASDIPNPLQELIEREEWDALLERLQMTDHDWYLIEATINGFGPRQIAEKLGTKQGRVSWQIQQIQERASE